VSIEILSVTAKLQEEFKGLFSRTIWVSQYQKGKPFWIKMRQEMMGMAMASAGPHANSLLFATDR